jgi:hypothetical protein
MRGTSDTLCAPRLSVMDVGGGLLQIEDCLDAQDGVASPPGATVISLIDRNIEKCR